MNKRKIFIAAGAATVILASATAMAGAQAPEGMGRGYDEKGATPSSSMVVSVSRSGKAQITGTVASVSGTSITLASWGGNWVVDASSSTLQRGYGGKLSVSDIAVGHVVTAWGVASQTGWSITASRVRDDSVRETSIRGVVTNASATGMTVTTAAGKAYAVSYTTGTRFVAAEKTVAAGDITNGATVRVRGTIDATNSTISANTVRVSAKKAD